MVGSNGSEMACVINAVHSAVLHARLPVRAPIFASAFAVRGSEILELPNEEQEDESEAVVTIGVVPGTDLIVLSH